MLNKNAVFDWGVGRWGVLTSQDFAPLEDFEAPSLGTAARVSLVTAPLSKLRHRKRKSSEQGAKRSVNEHFTRYRLFRI